MKHFIWSFMFLCACGGNSFSGNDVAIGGVPQAGAGGMPDVGGAGTSNGGTGNVATGGSGAMNTGGTGNVATGGSGNSSTGGDAGMGGDVVTPSGGTGGVCVPMSCEELGAAILAAHGSSDSRPACGPIKDNCGVVRDCGGCARRFDIPNWSVLAQGTPSCGGDVWKINYLQMEPSFPLPQTWETIKGATSVCGSEPCFFTNFDNKKFYCFPNYDLTTVRPDCLLADKSSTYWLYECS